MTRQLRRRSSSATSAAPEPLEPDESAGEGDADADAEHRLAASAVSGREPPAGPQSMRGLPPVRPAPLAFDKPLCASLDGFTLHAATRAAALDAEGREALLRYALRPPIAQERVELRPDGLVRIAPERAYADGTVAVDMDPLSLLCRLAASVPPPRFHTVKYAGVLASASAHRPARSRIAPRPKQVEAAAACGEAAAPKKRAKSNGTYWPWADLLRRTLALDVLECPSCKRRMKLVAMVTDAQNIAHYLTRPRRRRSPPLFRNSSAELG